MITNTQISDGAITTQKLSDTYRRHRYCFDSFMQEPLCFKKGTLTTPGGTDLDQCVVATGRYQFEYTFIGDATDAFLPLLASEGGYNWTLTTATLARGVEINLGGLKDGHPRHHVPSTEDWFARVLFITDNASGIDAFFGFKKVAAPVETLTEYTDTFGIRILGDSSSTTGAFTLISNLNNGGTSDYLSAAAAGATPLEDATAVELEIQSVGGKGFAFVNGVQVTGLTFTWDSGDSVTPIFRLVQTTDLATQLKTLCVEAGPRSARTNATLLSLAGSTI